jgi:cytosine permease
MSMASAIISGVVGYTVVIILFCLMGIVGSDLGVPTCVTAFSSFGKKGARVIVSLLMTISMIGWFAVQTSVCGSAFSNLLSESFGVNFPQAASMIIWGLIMLLTAVYGINAINKLNVFAVPALFIITIAGSIMAMRQFGTDGLFNPVTNPTMSLIDGVVLTVSFMTAGALGAPDFTRYQKTRRDTILSSSLGVMPAGLIMLVMGAIMSKVAQQYDVSLVFVDIGIPVLGVLTLIFATWTTNTSNAYCAGLSAVLLFNLTDNKRAIATMLLGVIGTIAAMMGIADHFEDFLYILGDIILPVMGVVLADYWVNAKGKVDNYTYKDGWNLVGIISWLIGYGVIKLIPVGIPFFQGLVVAFVVQIILSKIIKKDPAKELHMEGLQ